MFWLTELSGVSRGLVIAGMQLTRFWSTWF